MAWQSIRTPFMPHLLLLRFKAPGPCKTNGRSLKKLKNALRQMTPSLGDQKLLMKKSIRFDLGSMSYKSITKNLLVYKFKIYLKIFFREPFPNIIPHFLFYTIVLHFYSAKLVQQYPTPLLYNTVLPHSSTPFVHMFPTTLF